MKGTLGLAIAAGLGIVGAVCNWLYLQQLASEQETVALVAVRPGVQLNIGDAFKESDLEPVPIPRNRAGNLIERAPQWSLVNDVVIGYPANRVFHGGEIILYSDLEAPAIRNLAETLQEDEVARWVPIDPRTVVTDQINPGDLVSFDVGRQAPTPTGSAQPSGRGTPRLIGPFPVLALGTRREPAHVEQAARTRGSGSANSIAILVKLVDGQYEPKAAELFEALRASGNQALAVQLHSSRLRDSRRVP